MGSSSKSGRAALPVTFPPQFWMALVWTLFVVGLAAWWMIFSLRLLDTLSANQVSLREELARQRWMLITEGSVLLGLLTLGGAALMAYMWRERAAFERVRTFFATYTHDIKTALASLRLQAEALLEDSRSEGDGRILGRLLGDVGRLEVQLENSLFVANPDQKLWVRPVEVRRCLSNVVYQFGADRVQIQGPDSLQARGDERAMEVVLRNLLHNSFQHGKAQKVRVTLTVEGSRVEVRLEDDGRGFTGRRERLGAAYFRHGSGSGTGVGLFIVRSLMERMGGGVDFPEGIQGFTVRIWLPLGEK